MKKETLDILIMFTGRKKKKCCHMEGKECLKFFIKFVHVGQFIFLVVSDRILFVKRIIRVKVIVFS